MRLAIHAPHLGLSLPDQPFGKDVANRGLYTALASHGGFEQINFCTAEQPPLATLQQQFGAAPGAARLTFRADANGCSRPGWPAPRSASLRTGLGGIVPRAYSLVGMIHTLALKVRELIGEVLLAPVQPGCLICTCRRATVPGGLGIAGRSTSASVRRNPRASATVASTAIGRRPGGST